MDSQMHDDLFNTDQFAEEEAYNDEFVVQLYLCCEQHIGQTVL